MRGALPNAYYFGFTGTPIDKSSIRKGTFIVFGKQDPQGYLDRHSIKESIEDRTTVALYYTLAP
jgi:type I restriction enzyme R subunit